LRSSRLGGAAPIWLVAILTGAVLLCGPGQQGPAAQGTCQPTKADAEGPFYLPDAPARNRTGQGLQIFGTVRSQDCHPIAGARLEWWSTDAAGEYDDAHRASQWTDATGRYRYETSFPGRYPGRPPHVHVRVTALGHRPLVTQLYPTSGQTTFPVDLVLASQ
jgi:protocatechuate 3,4-dioxygenase beta subunit